MIKEIFTPKLKDPIVIAAWPGMGEVAYRSVLFLREVMGFKMFAKLEAEKFFRPAAVSVEKGVVSLPRLPAGFFYYLKGKKFADIILFLGEAQPPLEYAQELSFAAESLGLYLESCSEDLKTIEGIKQSACIDGSLLSRLTGKSASLAKDPGQRPACRCTISCDIGSYRDMPCPGGCLYCYANPIVRADRQKKAAGSMK